MEKRSSTAAFLQHYKEFKKRCEEYFARIGHPKNDFPQLWLAIQQVRLTLRASKTGKESHIGIDKAIEVLGEDEFLSGISRSAFHFTAERKSADGEYYVDFDLRHWLKR